MRYQGSKNRLVKSIVPILQQLIDENKIETYIEPFVGSAAVIQEINCKRRNYNFYWDWAFIWATIFKSR